MPTKEVEATTVHSTPDPDHLLSQLGNSFIFGDESRCVYYARGSSDLYKVYSPLGNFYLRLTRAGTRAEGYIRAEIEFLKFCSYNGCSVSVPICDTDGVIIKQIQTPEGNRPLTIFREAPGKSISKPSPSQLENFGRQLAIFHRRADRFTQNRDFPNYDLDECLNNSIREIGEFLQRRPEIRKHGIFYQNLSLRLKKRLRDLPLNNFSWGVIHGDFIYSNFKADSQNDITLYDFERIGYGWRAYEISTYIGHLISGRLAANPIKLYSQVRDFFLKGYESVAPLTKEEKEALPLFYQMQRIWMKSVCCRRYIDWSSSFMSISSWKHSVRKHKSWAIHLSKLDGI